MKFSLKKKLKRAGAIVLAGVLSFGMLSAVPEGVFVLGAKAEETADGYTVDTPEAGVTYTFDFIEKNVVSSNQGTYGLFSFDAGNSHAASYRGDKYGVQFNEGNKLTFQVPGNAYVVVTGDNNSNAELTATSETGTIDNPKQSSQTAGYCSINDCLQRGTNAVAFRYTGDAGAVTIEVGAAKAYINSACVIPIVTPALDTSKIDVWDFGGEALEGAYNNNIDYAFINSCYPDAAGTKGVNISSFTAKDGAGVDAFKFVTNKTNNRWRMKLPEDAVVTHYDDKDKTDAEGNVYSGYLYSNNTGATPVIVNPASTNEAHVSFYLYEGDILTCWLGSNSNAATYAMVDENGKQVATFDFTNSAGVEKAVFYGSTQGWYTLYCTNEKLVLARAMREHTPVVTVSGNVTAPDSLTKEYGISFTNTASGAVVNAKVTDGQYSVKLNGGYTYDVALVDANGYVIESEASVAVEKADKSFDVRIKAVELVTVTGKMSGIAAGQLANMKLAFASNEIFVPELDVDTATGDFVLKLEKGVSYAVTADGVNDYELTTTTIQYSADANGAEIQFTKKPVYEADVQLTGLPDMDTSNAVITFTNINEEGYIYTFGIQDKKELRDGQYSVKVTGLGNVPYVQGVTPDVKINQAAGSTVVPFSAIDDWDVAVIAKSNQIETIGEKNYFAGLELAGSVALNKGIYILTNAGATVTVPNVKAGDVITVSYCYSAAFKLGDITVDEKSGSTSKIDSQTITAAADGPLVIEAIAGENATQTYFTAITVNAAADRVAYTDTITVGADKQYQTVGAALDAVRSMDRTADQNVTIMIDPGNYEEMLVIDTPNVTLKNASLSPSIELANSGVDIDENAVRITWYYGHGYTYYSMGNDSKFDAALLEANKSNGYPSYINTGSGTTNGSYWNATVVVTADNVSADGIIFENSFNQYVSAASVNDIIVSQSGAKNGEVKRDDMKTVGDTTVQNKAYVERAAALAITNDVQQVYFNHCKFIGRQDTLYGGTNVTAAFNKCSVYGGTDYIFGAMTAVFNKCDLVFNTSENNNDVGYITAPQQTSGRGYLMNECRVTSTHPGIDTASAFTSKPGYLGRPWQATTGEAVFYKTIIDEADANWGEAGTSLILPAGWLSTLGGESAKCAEYGTVEISGADNLGSRAAWSTVLEDAKLADGTDITIAAFLGDWNPFPAEDGSVFEIEADADENAPAVTVEASKDAIALTPTEQILVNAGQSLKLIVEVSDISALVSEEDKALVAGVLKDALEGCVVGQYIDISLFKKIGSNPKEAVSQTEEKVKVTITIPENLKNTDASVIRSYYIIRVHEGVATVLDGTYDEATGAYTFETDQFSTYAIAYKDVPASANGGDEGEAPKSGDSAALFMLLALLAVSGGALLLSLKKKRVA